MPCNNFTSRRFTVSRVGIWKLTVFFLVHNLFLKFEFFACVDHVWIVNFCSRRVGTDPGYPGRAISPLIETTAE
eukprot:2677300-Rhodomonas_salina.1